jgi:hypothetical protein
MKHFRFVFLLLLPVYVSGQQSGNKFEPSGKVSGQIFVNYHYDFTKGAEKKSQFEVLRSNFGYAYSFTEKLTGKIVMDAANDGKAYSAFLKCASLEFKTGKLSFEGGMMKTFMFDTQEDSWGYRYVMESIQDKDKFYYSYDLGFKASYRPTDFLQLRAGVFNGEGFKKLQDDFGIQRGAFDLVLFPARGVTFKVYYDFMPKRDTAIHDPGLLYTQNSTGFFLGYDKPGKYRLGAEYNIQRGNGNRKFHTLNEISFYGTLVVKKFELFSRYDNLSSNTLEGESLGWNAARDYRMLTGGIQYVLSKGVRTALNYRNLIPQNSGSPALNLIYLNLEVKF